MNRARLATAARIAVSAGLLGGLVWWIGPAALLGSLRGASWPILAASFACSYLTHLIGAANVVLLTRIVLPEVRVPGALRAWARSWAVGMVAPGQFGELSYAHFLTGEGANLAPGLAVSVVDKIVTFVVTSAVAVVGLAVHVGASDALTGGLFAAAATAAALTTLLSPRLRGIVRRRILGRHAERFTGFAAHLSTLLGRNRAALAVNVALTILRTVAQGITILLSLRAFGAVVSLADAIVVHAVATLVSIVPITFSGLGLRQGAAVVLFGRIAGIPPAPVLGQGIVFSAFTYLNVALALTLTGARRRGTPA